MNECKQLCKSSKCITFAFDSFSDSLPSRQVQMSDVATLLVVGLLLSSSCILLPSSNPATFVLVFLLTYFLTFSLRLPCLSMTLILTFYNSPNIIIIIMNTRSRKSVHQVNVSTLTRAIHLNDNTTLVDIQNC